MSEVFVVAWRRRDDEPVDRLPWLLAVARRVIANGRRSDERVDALRLRLAGQPPPAEPDHGDVVAVRDTWSRALAQLSQDDQEVLALVAWDQLSASQAAAVLGCSTATFLVRLSRARRRLRTHLTSATAAPAAWKETDRATPRSNRPDPTPAARSCTPPRVRRRPHTGGAGRSVPTAAV